MSLRLRGSGLRLASQLPLCRLKSTWTHHKPSPSASREVPTPLVLLSASRWSGQAKSEESLSAFSNHFASRGWSVSCLDLDPDHLPTDDSIGIISALESELTSQLSTLGASPFPPLLIARNLSTLVAESYVSSHALSGLVLLDPPINPEDASNGEAGSTASTVLPTPLPAFTYEVTFPCLVGWSPNCSKGLAFWQAHRIEHMLEDEADAALDRRVFQLDNEGEDHGAGPNEVRLWAEECGILHHTESALEETEVEGAKEESEGEGEGQARQGGPRSLPTWYLQGNYSRNPTAKFRKEPLLIDPAHVTETFIRGSGPGGQAINKLATCVQLKHHPTGLVVRCQDTRSRETNRELGRRKLSKELERVVFGEMQSVVGQKALKERRKKAAKKRKQRRKSMDEEK